MFKRRSKPGLFYRVRGLIWPHIGWRRAGRYFYHRLMRLPGSAHSIAAGFACGSAISFTPFIGFHFVLSALLAWTIGGNVVAALIGTVVGNPWTFPFIWVAVYKLGSLILGWKSVDILSHGLTLTYILQHPQMVLLPMIVGSVPAGVLAWVASYWPVRYIVSDYQAVRRRLRERRRRAKALQAGSEPTGRRDAAPSGPDDAKVAAGGRKRREGEDGA